MEPALSQTRLGARYEGKPNTRELMPEAAVCIANRLP
jgi:hypothetical protein